MNGKTYITDLVPSSSRKSFYGRAKVVESNGIKYLLSYKTIVASVDKTGRTHRYYDGKTATTSSHIISFLKQFGDLKENSTRSFYELPCEKAPVLTVEIK